MGHQTLIKECSKCKGVIITTKAFGKVIKSTNCKCINKTNRLTLACASLLLCAVFTSCQGGIGEKSTNKEFTQWLTEITFNNGIKDTLIIKSECEPHLTIIDGKSIVRACGYSVYATDVRLLKIIK